MTFDSVAFLAFLAVFFLAYHQAAPWLRAQNLLLLGGSYFSYGWWDWRFLGLMTLSSGVGYLAGLAKHFDFFATSPTRLLAGLGLPVPLPLKAAGRQAFTRGLAAVLHAR